MVVDDNKIKLQRRIMWMIISHLSHQILGTVIYLTTALSSICKLNALASVSHSTQMPGK